MTDTPLLFIDTTGLDLSELVTPDEESKGNEGKVVIELKLFLVPSSKGVSTDVEIACNSCTASAEKSVMLIVTDNALSVWFCKLVMAAILEGNSS